MWNGKRREKTRFHKGKEMNDITTHSLDICMWVKRKRKIQKSAKRIFPLAYTKLKGNWIILLLLCIYSVFVDAQEHSWQSDGKKCATANNLKPVAVQMSREQQRNEREREKKALSNNSKMANEMTITNEESIKCHTMCTFNNNNNDNNSTLTGYSHKWVARWVAVC